MDFFFLSGTSTLPGCFLLLLTSNSLASRLGKRKLVLIDSFIMLIGCVITALGVNVPMICIGRGLMGEFERQIH